MEYPITKEMLHDKIDFYKYIISKEELIIKNNFLLLISDKICANLIKSLNSDNLSKQFTYNMSNLEKNGEDYHYMHMAIMNTHRNHMLIKTDYNIQIDCESIANSLKERFPNCNILIDPLEKYLIIDWS